MSRVDSKDLEIAIPEAPFQYDDPQILIHDIHVDSMIGSVPAREQFKVSGKGLAVAVLDTGLRITHQDFKDRIVAQHNFTFAPGSKANEVTDVHGHGTHVTGIIAGRGAHTGIAYDAGIVPLKVQTEQGGNFLAVQLALQWVLDNHKQFDISVVSMSLGTATNETSDAPYKDSEILMLIRELADRRIPVVVAAGNEYFKFQTEGMAFPAILRETISVGAVYDGAMGGFSYKNGAIAFESASDTITPFSQRLSESMHAQCYTDIFAPGSPITSTGIMNDQAESVQSGTSQAAPVVSGVIMLLQEYYKRTTGTLPTIDELAQFLRRGAVTISDTAKTQSNVTPSGRNYLRVDAHAALSAAHRALKKELLSTSTPFSMQRAARNPLGL